MISATASTTKVTPRKQKRPPNILAKFDFDTMTPEEALTAVSKAFPRWVRL